MNKGFGLNELIIFLVLFVIILIVSSIALSRTFDTIQTNEVKTKPVQKVENKISSNDTITDVYGKIKNKMENATKLYFDENPKLKKEQTVVKIADLIKKDYLESIIDPSNDKKVCTGYIVYNGNEDYDTYLKCSKYQSKNYDINLQ